MCTIINDAIQYNTIIDTIYICKNHPIDKREVN